MIFPGVSSKYLRHELARHKRNASHVVLFNYRCQGQNQALWESFGVRVHGRGEHSIDGVKYFEQLLQDGKLYGVEEVNVPKQCILIEKARVYKDAQEVIVHRDHRDLSQYTRPGTRDLNGSELLQVHEHGQNWHISLIVSSKGAIWGDDSEDLRFIVLHGELR